MKSYWKRNKLFLFITLFFGILSAVFTAFVSVVLQKIIDAAMSKNMSSFQNVMLFTLFYVILLCIFSYLSSLTAKYLLLKISKQMREDIFNGIMRHSPAQFFKMNTADYISMLTNDIKSIEENYILNFLTTIELIVMFLSTLIILLFLSPVITIFLIVNMLLIFLIPSLLGKLLEKRQDAISKQLASYTEKLKDIFSGFDVIKSYRMLPHIRSQFQTENEKTVKMRFAADRMFALNEGLSDMLSTLSIIIVIFISSWLVMKDSITMGTLLALTQLSGSFMTPVIMIMQNIPKLQSMRPVIEKILYFSEHKDTLWIGKKAPKFEQSIIFDHVSFSYDGDNPVLNNIDFTFEKGKKYALLGGSGCGKTTLVKLLSGYYPDYEGSIFYDGTELKDMKISDLSKLLCMTHQNVYLFNTSIKNNVTLFDSFSDKEMKIALEQSGVSTFLYKLENGLDTEAGENGSHLSGGQKQRVSLARAFIRNIDFIILDEGTSAVDRKTAFEIESNLLEDKNLTLITITHSLTPELLQKYDEILFMKNGKIEASGTYSELHQTHKDFCSFIG